MMLVRPSRRVGALALAAVSAALLPACQDLLVEPAAPATGGLAFALVASASSAGDTEAFNAADEARIQITSAGGDVLIDDVFELPEPGAQRLVQVDVPLESDAETLEVEASLLYAGEPVFQGTSSVRLERGQTATASVTLDAIAAGIEVASPSGPITAIGNTVALDGAAVFATGDPVEGASLGWESLDPDVATVSAQGMVTALAEGAAHIVARYLDYETTVIVQVDPVAARIVVVPTSLQLAVGEGRTVTATVYDANDNVLNRRPTWRSSAPSIATVVDTAGFVRGIAEGEATVTATVDDASTDVVVTVMDPCMPRSTGTGDIVGAIEPTDCMTSDGGRRTDYYSVAIANGEAVEFTSSGSLAGSWGVKESTTDARAGAVYGSVSIGGKLRVIGSGAPLQLFVSGQDAAAVGTYTITRSAAAEPYACGTMPVAVVPGATFSADLTPTNACAATVMFSPYEEAIGQPILTHGFNVKLDAGVTYTMAVSGFTKPFSPALTVFADGAVVAQDADVSSSARTVSVTVPQSRYVFVEVSSGYFLTPGNWDTPSGSYTLSVSH
jgi:uncharacterized protein YjdB